MDTSHNDWQVYFLDKFKEINDKAITVSKCVTEKEHLWQVDDMAGHIKDVIEILKHLDTKLDDIQYQLDNNKIEPSPTELERMKNYEIEHKVIDELFPYIHLFHTYYKNLDK